MKKILTIALAAATLAGGLAATATPAAARDWGGRDRHYGHDRGDRDHYRGGRGWREHDGWRDRDGWRGRDRDFGDGWRWSRGGYRYGYGSRCYSTWRYNPYWGRSVRVTTCR